MSAPADEAAVPPAAPDVAEALRAWLQHLSCEKQFAANTLEAYERDIRQLLTHLCARHGKPVTLAHLNCLGRPGPARLHGSAAW